MYKLVIAEIIAFGKRADDKAWKGKQNKLLREHGLGSFKHYRVVGREGGRVWSEGPEFETWQEVEEWQAKYGAIEDFQELHRERDLASVVPGSNESFILTDY
jgi:hypothetical protein